MTAGLVPALRWTAFYEGFLVLGVLIGLYARIFRFFLPASVIRPLIASGALAIVALQLEIAFSIGEKFRGGALVALLAMTCYLGALVRYYVWTRSYDGRRYRHHLRAEYLAERLMRVESPETISRLRYELAEAQRAAGDAARADTSGHAIREGERP